MKENYFGHPFIYPFANLFGHPFGHPFVNIFGHPFAHPYVYKKLYFAKIQRIFH